LKQYDIIMIRFGELSTKKKNKVNFVTTLYHNIRQQLKNIDGLEFEKAYDRIYIHLHGVSYDLIVQKLEEISGIQSFSLALLVHGTIEAMQEAALSLLESTPPGTFKVSARRSEKGFPLNSMEINQQVGAFLVAKTQRKVDVKHPDVTVHFEVRAQGVFLFHSSIPGLGGFPLGTAGKSMLLISGGIDSPVAGYLMMRRGVKIEAVHFASPPYTSPGALKKVVDLLKVLSEVQGAIRLHIVPFTALQERIFELPQDTYAITIMRRMMYRIAEQLALQNRCTVLSSGESIGQVASQTLESMRTINEVVSLPMIRPLAVMDKNDIISYAKRIGTYEISIRPFIDCCTIFTPKNPITKPTSKRAKEYEDRLNYESLLLNCLSSVETITITPEGANGVEEDAFF
jgi:thiamine biosynthesis protein ThiI